MHRRCAPRAAGPGQFSAGDLGGQPDLAGRARQMDSGKYPRHPAAVCLRRTFRRSKKTSQRRSPLAYAQRMEDASQESGLRRLPQDHGPDRILARQLRSDRRLGATTDWRAADRRLGPAGGRHASWTGLPACARRCSAAPTSSSAPLTEKLLTYATGRALEVLRHAGGSRHRRATPRGTTIAFRR